MRKTVRIIHCITRLHNNCINQRLIHNEIIDDTVFDGNPMQPTVILDVQGDPVGNENEDYRILGHSNIREKMAISIEERGLVRLLLHN